MEQLHISILANLPFREKARWTRRHASRLTRWEQLCSKERLSNHAIERTVNHCGNRVGNKILLSISDKEYGRIPSSPRISQHCSSILLYEPGQPIEFVHFPNSGMVSVIATEDGKTVEVGEVGRQGFAGTQAAVGINTNQVREVVQIAGDGFRVRIDPLQSVLQSAPELQLICLLCNSSGDAIRTNSRVIGFTILNSAWRAGHSITQDTVDSPDARYHPLFPDHARDGPLTGCGSWYFAEQIYYRARVWCSADLSCTNS